MLDLIVLEHHELYLLLVAKDLSNEVVNQA